MLVVIVAVIAAVVAGFVFMSGGDGSGEADLPAQVVLAAGDIAECDDEGDEATAAHPRRVPDATIAPARRPRLPGGDAAQFESCYGPSWGRFKDRTRPGDRQPRPLDEGRAGLLGLLRLEGGPYDKYYYSYDLGAWHVVVLNSDCWRVGGCELGDPQVQWLRNDLEQSPRRLHAGVLAPPALQLGPLRRAEDTERVRPLVAGRPTRRGSTSS